MYFAKVFELLSRKTNFSIINKTVSTTVDTVWDDSVQSLYSNVDIVADEFKLVGDRPEAARFFVPTKWNPKHHYVRRELISINLFNFHGVIWSSKIKLNKKNDLDKWQKRYLKINFEKIIFLFSSDLIPKSVLALNDFSTKMII